MAFGQSKTAAHLIPESFTSPHDPLSMSKPTSARQLPSFELGKPPKLQPHPKSQLQNSYPRPLSAHRVAVVVFAMCPPQVSSRSCAHRIGPAWISYALRRRR